MAGLRKPVRRKDTSKPSTALILFLVFFVILSIGLGIGFYSGFAGQEDLRTKARTGKALGEAGNLAGEYYEYLTLEARLATGGDTLTPAELERWALIRDEFTRDNGKFKSENSKAVMEKWVKEALRDKLGVAKDAKTYATNFIEKLTNLEKELQATKAILATKLGELDTADKKFKTLDTQQKTYWKNALGKIKTDNEEILKAAQTKSEEAKNAFIRIDELITEVGDLKVDFQGKLGTKDQQITKLNNALKAKAQENNEQKSASFGGSPHALVLDIAKGRPLWDAPLGKITRVDLQNGQVYLTIGSSSGLKTEASFMVFGSNTSGLPEKMLKATVEVSRIIDKTSSVARITSLYDAEGLEIVLSDSAKGRLEREASNPLKEGDLLFNMFFGARVAVAGIVNLSGYPANSPAEQMRELENFTFQLNRMGMTVDAFLDLNDAQVKGVIAPRTRFLILGHRQYVANKEKDADDKEKAADPAQILNDQYDAMKKDAVAKGLLVISLENFVNVTGLRRARSANSDEKSAFRPGLPVAGQGLSDLIGTGAKTGDDTKEKEK